MDYNMIGTAWSLLPPIVAIALALKTKEVYSSLFIGIILGAVQYCISMGTGFDGFLVHLTNHTVGEGDDAKAYGLIHCLSDPWNVGILVFLVVLGSIVSLMNKAGGSAAFGRWASKHVKSKTGVQVATILLGILIFIDDYFNCLTVGSVMRPYSSAQWRNQGETGLSHRLHSSSCLHHLPNLQLGSSSIGLRIGRREWTGTFLQGDTLQFLRILHHPLYVWHRDLGLRLQGDEQV